MSRDSDSDFDDPDFLSAAVRRVHTGWSKTNLPQENLASTSTDSSTEESPLHPIPAKRQRPAKEQPSRPGKENKVSLEDSLFDDGLVEDVPQATTDEILDITPPSSPKGSAKYRSVRGAIRTKKTIQALAKIERQRILLMKRRRSMADSSLEGDDILVVDNNIEEETVHIKVKWRSKILRVEVKSNEKLGTVMDRVAGMLNLDPDAVCFSRLDGTESKTGQDFVETLYTRDMTVKSAGMNIATIVRLRLRHNGEPKDDSDSVELKIQTSDRRATVRLKVKVSDPMSRVKEQFCQLKNIPLNSAKFYMDGELLEDNETCDSLDLEGGECIDVHIS